MAKNTAFLFALVLIHRPDLSVEQVEGKPVSIEAIEPGRVFEPADDAQSDELIRLGAARPATKDETTIEEERRKREGEDAKVSTIVASTGSTDTGGKAAKGNANKKGPDKPANPDPLI